MVLCLFLLLAVLAGCGSTGSGTTSSGTALAEQTGKKPLVIYFTYSENIGNTSDMSVDAVTSASLHEPTENKEGNMQVMVKEIQEKTGADAFSILVQEPYDPKFEIMRERAVKEIDNDEMIPLMGQVPDLSQYDTIYFGTPVWHYTLPPAVRTFLKQNDLSGKTVVPFDIHRGSEFSTNLETIKELQPKITMTDGFTIDGRTSNAETQKEFRAFLDKLLSGKKG